MYIYSLKIVMWISSQYRQKDIQCEQATDIISGMLSTCDVVDCTDVGPFWLCVIALSLEVSA